MRVALYLGRIEDLEFAKTIVDYLNHAGFEVYAFRDYETKYLSVKKFQNKDVEYSIVIGGDGTLLRYIHDINEELLQIPILHIGTGRVNYLCDVEKEQALEAIKDLIHRKYIIDERELLRVRTRTSRSYFLNEVLVRNEDLGKLITVSIYEANDCEIITARMDGVIIATPTGSTAYSLSAGGSVIDLRVKAKIITPLAPFSRSIPSVVHPLEVPLRIISQEQALIICDGVKIWSDKEVLISYEGDKVKLLRTRKYNYYLRFRKRILML